MSRVHYAIEDGRLDVSIFDATPTVQVISERLSPDGTTGGFVVVEALKRDYTKPGPYAHVAIFFPLGTQEIKRFATDLVAAAKQLDQQKCSPINSSEMDGRPQEAGENGPPQPQQEAGAV